MPDSLSSRRSFLRGSVAAAGAGFWIPDHLPGRDPVRRGRDDKLRIAVVGCGGKGFSDMRACAGEQIVALCDVDAVRAAKAFEDQPDARRYVDFREMLDVERDLDAVVVSTPDHTHAVAAVAAMQRGLHVFCQKPLTHSVEEARVLRLLAQRTGVVTQMGNQGTASDSFRRGVEVVRAGHLGDVTEVHVWTNRPVWPQGLDAPEEVHPIPKTLRWDLWLGPAAHRPYNKAYLPFSWRGWWDFGTGAIGDMACHTLNLPYLALRLGAPEWVEAEQEGNTEASPPKASTIRFRFPARDGLPAVDLTWYDGGRRPPQELFPEGVKVPNTGSLMVGSKGMMFSPGDYGTNWKLLPEASFADHEAPEPTLPRVGGSPHREWIEAIKGGPNAPMSRFEHAGPFTEAALLGNLACRVGRRIHWDPVGFEVTGDAAASKLLRDTYAYGFELGI